ncbi:MAG: hypothetical protein KAS62_06210, partial [Candidatus Delongbacteria bacterium]|nr:hypothetical protein [Candidatus Delongbacteria bacterium]
LDIEKNTKGPIGKNYLVTTLGKKKLLDEIKLGLSEIREYDPRFKIALSGIYLLKKIEVCKLLNKRILFLKNESKRINTKKELTEHNNFIAQMLFEHSLQAINSEIKFTIYLIKKYKE